MFVIVFSPTTTTATVLPTTSPPKKNLFLHKIPFRPTKRHVFSSILFSLVVVVGRHHAQTTSQSAATDTGTTGKKRRGADIDDPTVASVRCARTCTFYYYYYQPLLLQLLVKLCLRRYTKEEEGVQTVRGYEIPGNGPRLTNILSPLSTAVISTPQVDNASQHRNLHMFVPLSWGPWYKYILSIYIYVSTLLMIKLKKKDKLIGEDPMKSDLNPVANNENTRHSAFWHVRIEDFYRFTSISTC